MQSFLKGKSMSQKSSPLKFTPPEQIYKLNPACGRTRKRVANLYRTVSLQSIFKSELRLHASQIADIIGPRSSSVANILKQCFVITNGYTVGSHPYKYKFDFDRFNELIKPFGKINIINDVDEFLEIFLYGKKEKIASVKQQIKNRKFEYEETDCGRYYHPFNNVPKKYKQEIFTKLGMPYDYDIEAAMPTMLTQFALNECGLTTDDLLPLIFYIENRTFVRDKISSESGMDKTTVKRLLNAAIYGGKLDASSESILTLESSNWSQVDYFVNCDYIKQYKASIKLLWTAISKKVGKPVKTGEEYASVYYAFERQALDVMYEYCTDRNMFVLLEHDGIRTSEPIDMTELQKVVKEKTGFEIKLDGNLVSDDLKELATA